MFKGHSKGHTYSTLNDVYNAHGHDTWKIHAGNSWAGGSTSLHVFPMRYCHVGMMEEWCNIV